METRYATEHAVAAVPPSTLPQITPTRYSLDNRFPQLGFTINTQQKPYFEVLLTTDRALFEANRAADRSAANFFPARPEDRQLLPAQNGSSLFIVPQTVLHTFASATPRPQAIYYTVISYADTSANDPTFAQPVETLSTSAPSVQLSADFRAETLSAVLGIPVTRLHRYQRSAGFADVVPVPTEFNPNGRSEMTSSLEPGSSPNSSPEDGYEYYHMNGAPTTESQGSAASTAEDHNEPSSDAQIDYPDDDLTPSYSTAQQSWFPKDMPEPAALEDTEEPGPALSSSDDSDGFTYDDGFGALQPLQVRAASASISNQVAANSPSITHDNETPELISPDAIDAFEAPDAPSSTGNGYKDEADEYSYDESFAAESYDLFLPELPYEPLSAVSLGGGPAMTQPLTIEAQRSLIDKIAQFESGRDRYSAINRDGEFNGQFGQNHPAYHRYHIGLSYGIVQFTQDSGNLGRLLTMMRARDQARFQAVFGADSEALLRVTNAAGPVAAQTPGGRSARVQPVGGADLWEEPWIGRFTQAGQHVPFQAAQNELTAQLYITPILPFAKWLGLTTDRALAIVVDRAVQLGVGGARSWIIRTVGPIQTVAQRQQALTALGHADLRNFQRATPGLTDDGDWGPQVHAALVAALRGLGARSPIEIPTRSQMLAAMVRQSASERWGHRVQTLHTSPDFHDVVYDF